MKNLHISANYFYKKYCKLFINIFISLKINQQIKMKLIKILFEKNIIYFINIKYQNTSNNQSVKYILLLLI